MTNPCTKEREIQEIRDLAIESKTRFEYIQKDIKDIKENHLAHMQVSLESMEKQINQNSNNFNAFKYKTLAWSSVGAVIGSILIQLFFVWVGRL